MTHASSMHVHERMHLHHIVSMESAKRQRARQTAHNLHEYPAHNFFFQPFSLALVQQLLQGAAVNEL